MAKPRRRRAGRPRKVDAARFPGGKLRQDTRAGPTDELLAKRAELVGSAYATHPDAGWLVGILYLRGELHPPRVDTEEEESAEEAQARADVARNRRDAAERFVRLSNQHRRLIGAPQIPSAVDPLQTPGSDHPDDPAFYARVRAEWFASIDALMDAGHMPMIAVIRACRDEWAPLSYLPAGLDALHEAGPGIKRAGRRAADMVREAA